MRTALRLAALVAFAAVTFGQAPKGNPTNAKSTRQPAATRIGEHRLGETFNEWLAVEKIDLDSACQDHEQTFTAEPPPPEPPQFTYPAGWTEADFLKSMAAHAAWSTDKSTKEQAAFLKTLSEGRRHSAAVKLCSDLRPIRDAGSGYFHDRRGLPYDAEVGDQWTFSKGKLVGKQDIYSTEITTKELGFLREAYGPPTQTTKIPQQNAFGAKWDDILMTWHLPDGATLYMKALGGPKDDLIITFRSKDYPDDSTSKEPNPYLPKPQ